MSAKKSGRGNTHDVAAQEIRRVWGDAEVVNAKKELRVFISPEDVASATEKDPAYCVFAQACRRTFHATKVLFFRTVAYIELPDERGVRRVERFLMSDSMRDLIESFDRGHGVVPEGGFVLRVPKPSKSLNSEYRRRRERARRHQAKLQGEGEFPTDPPVATGIGRGKGKFRDQPLLVDLSVRSGIGSVKFRHDKRPKTESEKVDAIIGRLNAKKKKETDS